MNRKIGMIGAGINALAVVGFAVCMLLDVLFGCYFCSMFIAFSFVVMIRALVSLAAPERKAAGYAALAFAAAYAAIILLVYFTQLTTVRAGELTRQARDLLDFQRMGLAFNLDLLGYALMALSTFFAGFTIHPRCTPDRWLNALLMIHGVFYFSCLLLPMLGVFQADGPAWVGVAALEFWCVYFCPVAILSLLYFKRQGE